MKRKFLVVWLTVMMAIVCAIGLAACEENNSSAHEHAMVHHDLTEATCTENGNIEYWSCSGCGKNFADENGNEEIATVVIAATGHTYSNDWSSDNTYHWHAATCGHDEVIDKSEHVWNTGTVEKEPTCTETGERLFTCEICGATKTEIISMTEHDWSAWADDKNGRTHTRTCACGATETQNHEFGEWVDDENGTTHSRTCACGATETQDHHFVNRICTDCLYRVDYTVGLEYIIENNNSCLVVGIGKVKDSDIIIPSSYQGVRVTGIGDRAFSGNSGLKSIMIPDSVTSIGNLAFHGCSGLTSIMIPDSVTSIGNLAFHGCSELTSITIPVDVTNIGYQAFSDCSGLETIYYNAKNIADFPFLDEFNRQYSVFGNAGSASSGITVVFGNSVEKIPAYLFLNNENIIEVRMGSGVISIGNSAFGGCSALTNVTLPNSVKTVGIVAFSNCTSLKSLTIPEKVTSIGSGAFSGCVALEEIYYNAIEVSDVTYNHQIFSGSGNTGCGITVVFGETVKTIPSYLFFGAGGSSPNVTKAVIGNNVTSIGEYAFRYCDDLKIVTIGKSVKSIGGYAFADCTKIEELYYDATEVEVGNSDYVFFHAGGEGKGLSLIFGEGVRSIPDFLFFSCTGLKNIIIPNGVTSIGAWSFCHCTGLMSVTIPDSVTSIGDSAFFGCTGLMEIYYNAEEISDLTDKSNVFSRAGKSMSGITVTFGETVASIPAYLFYINGSSDYYPNIVSVKLDNKLTRIGESAFSSCTELSGIYISDIASWCAVEFENLTANPLYNAKNLYCNGVLVRELIVPDTVTKVNKYAFYNCRSLTSLTIPDSVISIGDSAFAACSVLTEVIIPKGVTSIGDSAFSGCTGLEEIYYNAAEVIDFTSSSNVFFNAGTSRNGISVIFGETVKSIPAYLFRVSNSYYRPNITSVTIGNSVTNIRNSAFSGCSRLMSVTIGNNVTIIGNFAFYGCNGLTSISIPDNVTSIGMSAFEDCTGLTSITIPDSVTRIGDSAFSGCSNLESITLPFVGGNASATSASNSALFGYIFGTNSYTGGTSTRQYYSSSSSTTYYIPTSLKNVTIVGGDILYGAFYGCTGLISVTILDRVTSIGERAFYGCSGLTSIIIPDGVTSIGDDAFYGCSGLTSIIIPDGVTSIGDDAFYGCSGLTSIIIPDGVTSIGDNAFYGCSGLTSIIIPDSVTHIGYRTFSGCSGLTSVAIGNGVTSIGNWAFFGCTGLTEIYYNAEEVDDLTSFSEVFRNAGRSGNGIRVVFGEAVKTIPAYLFGFGGVAFDHPNIISVSIGNNVMHIGENAFIYCSRLTEVTIGRNVTSIENGAFGRCWNLIEVYNQSKLEITPGRSDYGGIAYFAKNVYTQEQGKTWLTDTADGYRFLYDGEKGYLHGYYGTAADLLLPNSFTAYDGTEVSEYEIYQYAFYACTGLTSITIPGSVTSIRYSAFEGCTGLTSITIPGSVTSIRYSAFGSCSGLASISVENGNPVYHSEGNCLIETASKTLILGCKNSVIPSDGSVTNIGNAAFFGCTGLTSITIPDSVTNIGNAVFSGCAGLTSITIPDSVMSIGNAVFDTTAYYNDSANWDNGVLYIGKHLIKADATFSGAYKIKEDTLTIADSAFEDCSGLTSIIIPDGVTSIGDNVFYGCSGLTSIIIPDSVTNIGYRTFYGCSGLTSITIPDSVTSIGNSAFDGCNLLETIYYRGTEEDWAEVSIGINNTPLSSATVYYFSADEPALNADGTAYDGNYWYYTESGEIAVWLKEN